MNANRFSAKMLFTTALLLAVLLTATGCGPGQIPSPTMTPVPTNTTSPTATRTSTLRPKVQETLIMEIDPPLGLEVLVANLIISPNLQHAAYILQENDLYVLIMDGKRWQPMEKDTRLSLAPTVKTLPWHN